tara:strand:+ start:223 stop:1089 length:867 start_codon:yes stop_codon:yes gene_type:complete
MKIKLILIASFIILSGCSASYEELKKTKIKNPQKFSEYLLKEYKNKATFEAEKMHDWNSAKLYSEKALIAKNGEEVLPEKITYWNLPKEKVSDINKAHKNLMTVYSEAKILDPYNLAIAISSLDCWAEQQEENWQIWDINKCKEDFINSLHIIYGKISSIQKNNESKESVTVVTKNKEKQIMQIIYFDFDEELLSSVSSNKLKNFINKNNLLINKYIIVGHADKKGTKDYNYKLSLKRAKAVKDILVEMGINNKFITLLGKGEESPAISTPDGIAHPANRRVEIKIVN